MKKILIASAAITALFASQAMAEAVGGSTGPGIENFGTSAGPFGAGNTSGGDGVAQWYIYGSAASYCVLGQGATGQGDTGTNVTIDTTTQNGPAGTGGNGYAGATSDGSVKINQLQGPNDLQNAWSAQIRLTNSVCNTAYTVTANSANGGLTNPATTTDAAFTNNLDYNVKVGFDGNIGNGNASAIHGRDATLATSQQAAAGAFNIQFTYQSSSKYLVAGNYADNVLIKLTANVGGVPS